MLILIIGVGLYLSYRTGFAQFVLFPKAIRNFIGTIKDNKQSEKGISQFEALCTALSATVGIGNLAGVAGAIAIGGPGAIFWMWLCAVVGMVTKFSEATLAVRYKSLGSDGTFLSGPMHMITNGLHKRWHWMAGLYCFFGVIAAFGVGNATQINAVVSSVNGVLNGWGIQESNIVNTLIGCCLAVLIVIMMLGGAKQIGKTTQMLIPFASLLYIALGAGALAINYRAIPKALSAIATGAFHPQAVTGGTLGSVFIAMRIGASRGVFTNEAGMGTAAIAHGSANVSHPAEQGLMGIVEVFIDTIVICSVTALVILSSGCSISYGADSGIDLTMNAFSAVYGDWVRIPLVISLILFALATVIGWGLYGGRCAQYLFGERSWRTFAFLEAVAVVLGAVSSTGGVWIFSEIVNGLMAIPNLIALILLSPELSNLTKQFKQSG